MVVERFSLPPARPVALKRRIKQASPVRNELKSLVEEKVETPFQAIKIGRVIYKQIETKVKTDYLGVYQAQRKDIQQRTFLRRELDALCQKHIKKYNRSGVSALKTTVRQAKTEISTFMKRYKELENKIRKNSKFLNTAYIKTTKEILNKLRPFSEEYPYLPALWVKIMQNQAPIDIVPTLGRGNYNINTDVISSAENFEMHSVVHRVQAGYEPLSKIEAKFWRATKSKYEQTISWIGSPFMHSERGIRQGFPDRYIGKYYPDNIFFEIMPVGITALFDFNNIVPQRIKRSKDFISFCLGVLAAV